MNTLKKGFTLIELLVVISIISLLASIVLASVSDARVRARDAKRITDLNAIRTALALYWEDHGRYPTSNGNWVYSTSPGNWIPDLAPKYISSVPKDPINNVAAPWATAAPHYSYAYINLENGAQPGWDGQEYDLIARFENINNSNRCELRCYNLHVLDPDIPWCVACGGPYSNYLYADH